MAPRLFFSLLTSVLSQKNAVCDDARVEGKMPSADSLDNRVQAAGPEQTLSAGEGGQAISNSRLVELIMNKA